MNDNLIPKNLMIPLGAQATKDSGTCADSWTDSFLANLRAQLPVEYHAVPVESMRRQFVNIRKRGTPGYKVKGKGPSKGSRTLGLRKLSQEHRTYLESPEWEEQKIKNDWIGYWKACCVCNGTDQLDVHHRTYERVGHELFTDCVVLCRYHHDLFHEDKESLKTAV